MNFVKKQLTLIDEEELLRDYTSGIYPNNVIIQNPFRVFNLLENLISKTMSYLRGLLNSSNRKVINFRFL